MIKFVGFHILKYINNYVTCNIFNILSVFYLSVSNEAVSLTPGKYMCIGVAVSVFIVLFALCLFGHCIRRRSKLFSPSLQNNIYRNKNKHHEPS